MLRIDEWKAYIRAVQSKPEDYTAQDRHLAELMVEVLDDRARMINDYLSAQARIRELEHRLAEAQAQVAYYRSRP